MKSLEERYLEIEDIVFKIDEGEYGSFYAQVVLAESEIGITAVAIEDFKIEDGGEEIIVHKKGDECFCFNNKDILEFTNKNMLNEQQLYVLESIKNRYFDNPRFISIFYPYSLLGEMSECAFK